MEGTSYYVALLLYFDDFTYNLAIWKVALPRMQSQFQMILGPACIWDGLDLAGTEAVVD